MKEAKLTITATQDGTQFEAEGTNFDILSLSLTAVRGIYKSLKNKDEDLADKYKDFILEEGKTLFMTDEELKAEHDKLLKEKLGDAEPMLDVLNELKEFLEELKK